MRGIRRVRTGTSRRRPPTRCRSTTALSVRNDASVISVARAVRRKPRSIERCARRDRDGEQPQSCRERQKGGRKRVDPNDLFSAGNPTERGRADREVAQSWRERDHERGEHHGDRRSDCQSCAAVRHRRAERRRRSRARAARRARQATAVRHSSRSPPSTAAGARAGSTASHSHWSRRVSKRASRVNGSTTARSRMLSRNPRSSAIRNSRRRARSDPHHSEMAAVWRGVVTDGVLRFRADRGGRSARSGIAAAGSRRVRPDG